jgi:hypothetical protein
MNMRWRLLTCLSCAATIQIAGMTSASAGSSQPYWEDAVWQKTLMESIGNSVTYPDGMTTVDGLAEGTVEVEFDYQNRKLLNAKVIKTSGSNLIDQHVIKDLADITAPSVAPEYASISHHFSLTLTVQPDINQFRLILDDVFANKLHLAPNQFPDRFTFIFIDENYLNGKLTDVKMDSDNASDGLKSALVGLMDDVPLPPPPSNLKDIKLRLKIRLCVSKVLTDCFHNPVAYRQSFAGFTLALTPEQK